MRLKTARLLIRELVSSDANALYEIESDPEMVRYQDFEPRTAESAADYVSRAIRAAMRQPREWVELAVCENGSMIGRVGASIDGRTAWLWYAVATEYQGRGYAKESVAAFLAMLESLEMANIFKLECDPLNVASCKVAESIGFWRESETDGTVTVKGELCGSRVYVLTDHESAGSMA